jgi:hypothetical protein
MEALKRNRYHSSNQNSTGNFTTQVPNESEREAMLSCLAEELGCDQLLGEKLGCDQLMGEELGCDQLLGEELGCADQLLGEELGRLKRLARATPGFLASDLALLLSRIVSSSSAATLHQPGRRKKAGNFGIEKNGGKFWN